MSSAPASPSPASAPGAGRAIFGLQPLRLLLRLGGAAALARLLPPEAYGIHGMAAAVFGFLFMARDFGVGPVLQQPGFDRARFRPLCRFALRGGLLLAAFGLALAFPAGWLFGEPQRVPPVLAALSLTLLFSAVGAPAVGLLYREGRAATVAGLDTLGLAAGSLAAVTAAAAGAGVWSLVLLTAFHEGLFAALAWWRCPWRPGPAGSKDSTAPSSAFGARLAGTQVVHYATRTCDQMIVGALAGPAALGYYGRGAQLAALPAQFAVGPFAPWLIAELNRNRSDPAAFVALFRRGLNGQLHACGAAAALCLALPDVLVRLLLGPAWEPAVPVARALGVVLALQPLLHAPQWLLSAPATSRRLFAWSLAGLSLTLGACLAAAPDGFVSIAFAAAAATVLHAALAPVFCRGRTAVRASDWLAALAGPLALHGATAAAIAALRPAFAPAAPVVQLAAALVVGALLAAAGLAVSPALRRELRTHLFWAR